jgi:hypothetical protein
MEEDSWALSEGLLSLEYQPLIDAVSFPLSHKMFTSTLGYIIGFGDIVWLEENHIILFLVLLSLGLYIL